MKVVLILLIFENIVWGSKYVPGSSRFKLRGFDIHKKSGNPGGSKSQPLFLRQYVDYSEEHFSTKREDKITTDDFKTERGPSDKSLTEKNPTDESSTANYPAAESTSSKTTTIKKHNRDYYHYDDDSEKNDEYTLIDDDDYRSTQIKKTTNYETEEPPKEDPYPDRYTMKQSEETTTNKSPVTDNVKKDSLDSDPEDDYDIEPLFQVFTKYTYIPVWQGCIENNIVLNRDENGTKPDENDQDKNKIPTNDNKYGCKLRTGIDINNELRTLRIDKNKLKLRQKGEMRL